MKFETLKQSKIKYYIIGGVLLIGILGILIVRNTFSKYRTTQSINIVNGTINYTLGDVNIIAYYLQNGDKYDEYTVAPVSSDGYVFNSEASYCKAGGEVQDVTLDYDISTHAFTVAPYDNGKMKCYLYFDKQLTAAEQILANKTISVRTDFSTVLTIDTTGIIYQAEDDDGITYYFAGAPTDNYVYFAGFYWRIVRINGDGTIRLIYDGTSAIANGTSSTETQIAISYFNSSYRDNMYVGYMYTSGSIHGLKTASTIKGVLDSWFTSNLSSYILYLDYNAGFCNDRYPSTSMSSSNGSGGTGTTETYYAAYIRLITNAVPSFKCLTNTDLFTTSVSTKGNKVLTNPIGLITADEVAYAGGVYNIANSYFYLYTGSYYWTMTPKSYGGNQAAVFIAGGDNSLNPYGVDTSFGDRPVINLKTDVTFSSGTGSQSDPYVVAT